MSIESVVPSNHPILCHSLLFSPSVFPSIRVFSNEYVFRIRWPMYWSFSFKISPSNEYSGLISFRMDWLYLIAVQRTLKSLLQHHSSKVSILFFFYLESFFFLTLQIVLVLPNIKMNPPQVYMCSLSWTLLPPPSPKVSILQCSAFFMVQPSHPYMTSVKNIALTGWPFVSKVTSLLFHMLSRLAIVFF